MTTSPTLTASSSTLPPNPTTPSFSDDVEWITAYLVIHMMSENSRRYIYILWLIIVLLFLAFTVIHWTKVKGGFVGAYWSKWSLRRRTWRGKYYSELARKKGERNTPISLPPNGQLLCLSLLFLATLVLAFMGPDYISPNIGFFNFHREIVLAQERATSYDPSLFYQYQPRYTIAKSWWTSGGRTGLIAFALMPLCVLFALKSPPFAIFAWPLTTQMHFDKLAWLHRWSGRLIWLITALHVGLWSVQLAIDHRTGTNKSAYIFAWQYEKFIYGWIAFGLLTLLILLSSHPLRRSHYEAFYFLHVLLVPLTLILSALHHPPVSWWCWSALAIWLGERAWRGTWWVYVNGIFGRSTASQVVPSQAKEYSPLACITSPVTPLYPPLKSPSVTRSLLGPQNIPVILPSALSYVPPSGFAHAELLSGATVRLTFISPGLLSWAPGQHFLICIPSVSKFTTHPFTAASICDEQSPSDSAHAIIFLIRAKSGWTKDLWDHVAALSTGGLKYPAGEVHRKGTILPNNGVLLRMYVDGPFGSSIRAHWGTHSTILIVVGGSGVSFGLSILEYACLCLAGRDGKYLGGRPGGWGQKGFDTKRVRFVWLIREFGHIQWAASSIRRCTAIVPHPGLQVDIFVTNVKPMLPKAVPPMPPTDQNSYLTPPAPQFARSRSASIHSTESDESADSLIDLSYYTNDFGDEERDIGDLGIRENYTLELTNFDGDNEMALPGEDVLNRRIRKAGKTLRKGKSQSVHILSGKEGDSSSLAAAYKPTSTHVSYGSADALLVSSWRSSHQGDHQRNTSSAESDLGALMTTDSELPWHLPHEPIAPSPLSPNARFSLVPPIRHSDTPQSSRAPSPLIIPSTSRISAPASQLPPFSPMHSHYDSLHVATDTSSSRTPSVLSNILDTDGASLRPLTGASQSTHMVLQVNEREMHDVNAISEHARPGKPKLDRILEDEVQQAQGSVIVACCGPTSLNAKVRKSIAAQIDPGRIRRGDMRGYIDLVSEDFAY